MSGSRQLGTSQQYIRRQASQNPLELTRTAFLIMPLRGAMQQVLVTFSDPRTGIVGTTFNARIAPGVLSDAAPFPGDTPFPSTSEELYDFIRKAMSTPSLEAGSPVTVVIRRGQIEVVGF